jgi:hypothetical protein
MSTDHVHRSMTRRIGPLALILGLLLAAPAGAANSCPASPGTAAVDQYCESVPGNTTSSPPSDGHRHGHAGPAVPSSTAAALRSHPGGSAVLSGLPGQPGAANAGAPGSNAGSQGSGHRAHRSGPAPRKPHGGLASDFIEPAPHGALAGLKSAGGSLFTGEMAGVLAILALGLIGASAFAVRRRSVPER